MSKVIKHNKGFTLIELLIVMAIIGILVTVFLVGFMASQQRSRDVRRKSDLKQIANALEIFYADYERYPASDGAGSIVACDYDPIAPVNSVVCSFEDRDEFTDGTTTYFRELPPDPTDYNYFYMVSTDFQGFQLFAHLENEHDQNCLNDVGGEPNCITPDLPDLNVPTCATSFECNFAITSPNVTAFDDLD